MSLYLSVEDIREICKSPDGLNISSMLDQKVMLDAPPGGALTLMEVPLTLLPKASKVSATLP